MTSTVIKRLPRKPGRKPHKLDHVQDRLQPFGGLNTFLISRDQATPRPTIAQITDELCAICRIELSPTIVQRWMDRAYDAVLLGSTEEPLVDTRPKRALTTFDPDSDAPAMEATV